MLATGEAPSRRCSTSPVALSRGKGVERATGREQGGGEDNRGIETRETKDRKKRKEHEDVLEKRIQITKNQSQ